MSGRELTGNHYLCFPVIAHDGAVIPQVTALHSALAGVLAWTGEPLLRPVLEVDGRPLDLHGLQWERLDRWVPQAHGRAGQDCEVTLTVCAPAGYEPLIRGAFIDIQVRSTAAKPRAARASLEVHWRGTDLHVRAGRPVPGDARLAGCAGVSGLALETGRMPFGAALALGAGGGAEVWAGREGSDVALRSGDWESSAQAGRALVARVLQEAELPAKRTTRFTFYLSLGRDRESALAGIPHFARLGPDDLLRRGRLALSQLVRKAEDPGLNELLNRNLLFNHFFAVGRGLDDDRLHALASRSPLHGTTATFDEREALLWTLPALTLCDTYLARELLLHIFETFSGAPAQAARYLDGGILAPGFVLDHLLAYPLALARYAGEAEDESVIEDALIQDVLREVDATLYNHLHREVLLADTELLSSSEPADFAYPTFGNVLLWSYARALPRIWRAEEHEPPASFDGAADEIAAAIWQRCTVSVDGVPVLVSSTNLTGEAAVYDDPYASLALLPYLGFCESEDPIWRNTMELLHSTTYPLWHGQAAHPGFASRRSPAAGTLAGLAAELLGPERERALGVLRALHLTDGVASEQYDPATGTTAAGMHAAALAGLLAWALARGLPPPPKTRRKR